MSNRVHVAGMVGVLILCAFCSMAVSARDQRPSGELATSRPTEDASWGVIKALYRGGRSVVADASPRVEAFPSWASWAVGFRYPLRDSPENVLEKLREAYTLMDADAYLDCLSEDLAFFLNPEDLNDPTNPLPFYWGKQQEEAIHLAMFGPGSNVEQITLSLVQVGDPIEIPGPDPGDPSQWEYHVNYDLAVRLPNDLTFLGEQGAIFVLQIDPLEVGPSGEQLWEILTWFDADRFEVSPVEPSSWGAIKAMYR